MVTVAFFVEDVLVQLLVRLHVDGACSYAVDAVPFDLLHLGVPNVASRPVQVPKLEHNIGNDACQNYLVGNEKSSWSGRRCDFRRTGSS